MAEQTYEDKLTAALAGRHLRPEYLPRPIGAQAGFSFWGADAGIPEGDLHHDRLYQIYLDWDERQTITGTQVMVAGELISPCSGYAVEALDAFDFEPVLNWCLAHTAEQ